MKRLASALGLCALSLLCACDPLGGEDKEQGVQEGGTLARAPVQSLADAVRAPGSAVSQTVTAAGAAAATGDRQRSSFDQLYDNTGRALANPGPAGDGAVSGRGTGTKADPNALVNAESTVGKTPIVKTVPPEPRTDGILPPRELISEDGTVGSSKDSQTGDPLAVSRSGKKAKAKKPEDAGRDQILIVGDSHSAKGQTIGHWLPQKLKNVGNRVVDVYAVGGASSNWYNGKNRVSLNKNVRNTLDTAGIDGVAKLDELVTSRTKVVIIVLGTNHLDWQSLKKTGGTGEFHLDASRDLAKAAAGGGRKCFWVGEPDMIGLSGTDAAKARDAIKSYEAKLKAKVGASCSYVGIWDKTTYSKGDGIHYGDYEKVAEAAAAQIAL